MPTRRSLLALLLAALPACGPTAAGSNDGGPPECEAVAYCSGHGVCTVTDAVPACTCYVGWAGPECAGCAQGYGDDGLGNCIVTDPCTLCQNQSRECVGSPPSVTCGDCLPDFTEVNGTCYETCAAVSNTGVLVPLDLYIMLDRSSSMNESGKWSSVTAAITGFVGSADAAGIGVGLGYFPVPPTTPIPNACDPGTPGMCGLYGPCLPGFNRCSGSFAQDTSCDPLDYNSASVNIAELPGVKDAILASMGAHGPEGAATPTEPSMAGGLTYASAWATANPTHITFLVYATDGEPTGCSTNSVAGAAALAQAAANGTPPVKTFVIGVGSLASLDQIATAGGTGSAYLVDTGGNVTQAFIDALNDIRANRGCTYQLPPPDGGTLDPALVNVQVGAPPADLFNVANAAACDPTVGGWYYDDPAAPGMIVLCPATCDDVRLGNLAVDILVGCETIVL